MVGKRKKKTRPQVAHVQIPGSSEDVRLHSKQELKLQTELKMLIADLKIMWA